MIFCNLFSQKHSCPFALIIIIIHRKMQYFSFFVIMPVLCSIGSKNRIYVLPSQLLIFYIISQKPCRTQ